jgi:hypothetical protein
MGFLSCYWGRVPAAVAVSVFLFQAGCCPPVILTESLPDGRVGEPYHFVLQAECTTGLWFISGEVPPGLSFNSEGVFSGTPTVAGLYFLTINWEDWVDGELLSSVTKGFTLMILEAESAI